MVKRDLIMKQGIEKVWDLFLHNNFFKIMLFAWLIVLGGILEVYLDNLFSSIVLYIGCFGLLGYEATTLESVGKEIGLTRERVRQIQVEALNNLKGILSQQGLSIESLFHI